MKIKNLFLVHALLKENRDKCERALQEADRNYRAAVNSGTAYDGDKLTEHGAELDQKRKDAKESLTRASSALNDFEEQDF